MGKKLSIKQKKFIDAYIELGNATEAAKQAGYKCKNSGAYSAVGAENLRKLKKFIDVRLAELKTARTADLTEVIEFLTSVMRGKVEDEVINPVTGMKIKLMAGVRDRLGAAKELLKRYPGKLDEERQKLILEKLQLEIKEMGTDGNGDKCIIVDDVEARIAEDGGS